MKGYYEILATIVSPSSHAKLITAVVRGPKKTLWFSGTNELCSFCGSLRERRLFDESKS